MERINLHTLQGISPKDSDRCDSLAVFQNSDFLWEDYMYANLMLLNKNTNLPPISFKRYANT